MSEDHRQPGLSRLERVCLGASGVCLLALVLLIAGEVVARSVFRYSFEVVDELGGYLLVALTFLSLAPALAAGAFHSVELLQSRLSAIARRRWRAGFHAMSLAFALVMTFTVIRYVWRTFSQGDVASTSLQTPLWIPQSAMVIGLIALTVTLVRLLFASLGSRTSTTARHDA